MANLSDYKAIRDAARYASDKADSARSIFKLISETFDNGIIIAGKAFDNGEMAQCMYKLANISSNMNSIANYCNRKMNNDLNRQNNVQNTSGNSTVTGINKPKAVFFSDEGN